MSVVPREYELFVARHGAPAGSWTHGSFAKVLAEFSNVVRKAGELGATHVTMVWIAPGQPANVAVDGPPPVLSPGVRW